MKLYYQPGACSLSPHIVLEEAGLPYEAIKTDVRKKTLEDGSDFRKVNPKGYVPFLVLDDGQTLSEGPAIVQYIADKVPDKQLVPAWGTMERYRLLEWLSFIGTELHKSFGGMFNPQMPEEANKIARDRLIERYALVDEALASRPYLLGDKFSVADAYLFVITSWAQPLKIDLSAFSHVGAFMKRVAERPAVQRAMKAEGLI